MRLHLFDQKNLTVMLTFCNYVDNIDIEKYLQSMLNIYFPFTKPSSYTV